jgi:uncharacterized protein
LLGTRAPTAGPLLLTGAKQVHTFGMRYPIDVVFCDASWNVVHVVHAMRPWRVTRWVFRARVTIELDPAIGAGISKGDVLELETY